MTYTQTVNFTRDAPVSARPKPDPARTKLREFITAITSEECRPLHLRLAVPVPG